MGGPICYYPREEEGKKQGLKMGKRIPRKLKRTHGFLTWGTQIGTFKADFVPKMFHLFTKPPIIIHFFIDRPLKQNKRSYAPQIADAFVPCASASGIPICYTQEMEILQNVITVGNFCSWSIQTGHFQA